MMRRVFLVLLFISCHILLTGCHPERVREQPTLLIQHPIPLPESEFVTERIRNECNIATRLVDDIEYYAQKNSFRVERVETPPAHGTGQVLIVKITGLRAAGGGHWTRGRYIHIEGTLWNQGITIGSFVAKRESWSGNDACMSLARISRALGEDVGRWLPSPTLNARLGDYK